MAKEPDKFPRMMPTRHANVCGALAWPKAKPETVRTNMTLLLDSGTQHPSQAAALRNVSLRPYRRSDADHGRALPVPSANSKQARQPWFLTSGLPKFEAGFGRQHSAQLLSSDLFSYEVKAGCPRE